MSAKGNTALYLTMALPAGRNRAGTDGRDKHGGAEIRAFHLSGHHTEYAVAQYQRKRS